MYIPAVRALEARQHAHQGGLAAARRAEDGKKGALGHRKGDPIDSDEVAKGLD